MIEISLQFASRRSTCLERANQAKLEEFRQMPWIEPNYKETTLDGLKVVERY